MGHLLKIKQVVPLKKSGRWDRLELVLIVVRTVLAMPWASTVGRIAGNAKCWISGSLLSDTVSKEDTREPRECTT